MDDQIPNTPSPAPAPPNNGGVPQPPQPLSSQDTRPNVYRQMPQSYPARRPAGTDGIVTPGTRPSAAASPYLRPMNGARPPQSPQMDIQSPSPTPVSMRPSSPAPPRPVFQQSQPPSQPMPQQQQPQQYNRPMATPPQQQPAPQPYQQPPVQSNPYPQQPVAAPPQAPIQQTQPQPAPAAQQKSKKSKLRLGLSAVAVLIALGGLGKLGMWVANNYFSPYNSLTTASYDKGGIDYSFKYPASLKFDSLLSGNAGPSNVSITGMQSVTPAAYIL